jgi:hypothetical protein
MSVSEGVDAKGSEKGKATVKSSVCAMAVMADRSCAGAISDESEVVFEFSSEGKNLTDMTRTLSTKRSLGDAYGMSKSSFDFDGDGRILEWYKQADLFDQSLKGLKQNVINRLFDSKGMGSETLIKSGCTIKIDGMSKCASLALSNVK